MILSAVIKLHVIMLYLYFCLVICFKHIIADELAPTLRLNNSILFEVPPTKLFRLENLGNMQVFHWQTSFSRKFYRLRLSGTVNQTGSGFSSDCPDTNTVVIVRFNGIPLPSQEDRLIPQNTIIQHHDVVYSGNFLISSSQPNNPTDIILQTNKSGQGHFFFSLFLPTDLKDTKFQGITKPCRYFGSLKLFSLNSSEEFEDFNQVENSSKISMFTFRKQESLFNVSFFPSKYAINLTSEKSKSLYWKVLPISDSGGVLSINIKSTMYLNDFNLTDSNKNVSIIGCLKNPWLRPSSDEVCSNGVLLKLELTQNNTSTWKVPFPLSGLWELQLKLICADKLCSDMALPVELSVTIQMCIDNCMMERNQGQCGIYRTHQILLSACQCKVGWSGLSCNDGKNALRYKTQLLRVLFLTLSNLVYVPCVILASRRLFYTEGFLYFCVMITSTFYHACDQPGEAKACILSYETLQFSDFFYSVSAIWVTLIAVARLRIEIESFLKVCGVIVISLLVKHNRFGLLTLTLPVIAGSAVVGYSWKQKSSEGNCYPGKKKLLTLALPGLTCAFISVLLNAFVENEENYFIVHSFWHILTGSTLIFAISLETKKVKTDSPEIKEQDANNNLPSEVLAPPSDA